MTSVHRSIAKMAHGTVARMFWHGVTEYGDRVLMRQKEFGIWQNLEKHANPIDNIYVIDNYSPRFLHFIGDTDADNKMGFVVENKIFREVLIDIATSLKNIDLIDEVQITEVRSEQDYSELMFGNGGAVRANLLLACDGKFSSVRNKFFTTKLEKDYGQTAMIFNISHEKKHDNVAIEHFTSKGPFAILPLKSDGHEEDKLSSVIWIEPSEVAEIYLKMPLAEFNFYLARKMGNLLGKSCLTTSVVSYPLSAHLVDNYYYRRNVLVADSAHVIHPLAGQGLNLGIKDIASLVRIISYKRLFGCVEESDLKQYERERKRHNYLMFTIMDNLNRVFINDSIAFRRLRKIGMEAINNMTPLKNLFMEYAMGRVE